MKRFLWVSACLLLLLVLLRGCIFRQAVAYRTVGHRASYAATDNQLLQYLDGYTGLSESSSVDDIIDAALSLTTGKLRFTAANNDVDPNKLIHAETAHCVGYAAFFTTACNFYFRKYHLDETWVATPQIGQLYLFGENVHPYFSTPFFKDHDFAIIRNKRTGEQIAVDPNVYDYLIIREITLR